MRVKNVGYAIAGLALITIITVTTGCIFNGQPSQEATIAANATADSMFQALNSGDYGQFSANFSGAMNAATNERWFNDLRNQILNKYGQYVSRPSPQSSTVQGFNNFIYDCTFDKGKLKIRLVMDMTNTSIVQGLWFPNGI